MEERESGYQTGRPAGDTRAGLQLRVGRLQKPPVRSVSAICQQDKPLHRACPGPAAGWSKSKQDHWARQLKGTEATGRQAMAHVLMMTSASARWRSSSQSGPSLSDVAAGRARRSVGHTDAHTHQHAGQAAECRRQLPTGTCALCTAHTPHTAVCLSIPLFLTNECVALPLQPGPEPQAILSTAQQLWPRCRQLLASRVQYSHNLRQRQ